VSAAAQGPIDARLEAYRAMFRLDGKTALVLGAASGIGKASAEALAALGATVVCADKNKQGVETTAAEIGARAEAHVTDAGSAESINALAAAIEREHKQLDVAVTTPAVPQIWNALAAHTVFNRWADPSEVAAAVAFLACDAARYVTGTALLVDGGWTATDGAPTGLTKTHEEGATSA
jgi:NAD(P)-dependent dehydrogenase (short-subunit alcohol dehydrogenase family)